MTGVLAEMQNPWPDDRGAAIVFVIAGDDTEERALVRRWIEATRPPGWTGAFDIAEVDTARETEVRHSGLDRLFEAAADTLIAPAAVLLREDPESKRPNRLADAVREARYALGKIAQKRRLLRAAPERWTKIVGEAASLDRLRRRFARHGGDLANAPDFADFIARQAVLTIERERRKLPGGDIKLPRLVVPAIIARRDFRRDLEAIAAKTGRPLAEIEKEAHTCLAEIAPTPTPAFVAIMAWLMRAICSMGYSPNIVYDEARALEVERVVRAAPTAFLFTHKSHIDGMAMISFAFERKLPLLHTIGGVNMAFAGIGAIAKRSGAVFIRRSFQDEPVYKAALRHYIAYVLEKRFPLAWSLEGTRSRIGKLMPPRYGVLKYVVEAALKNGVDDLKIVPVTIYYDLIAEIESYASEQTGAAKRKESLAWFVGFVAGLKKPLGRIFMDFGAPIAATPEADSADEADLSPHLHRIAFETAVSINAATPVTASGALALVMLGAAPQALSEGEIASELVALRDFAEAREIPMTADFVGAGAENIRAVARALIKVGVLKRYEGGLQTLYGIAPGQSFAASYYRNTVVHFFVDNAIIELALAGAMDAGAGSSADSFWRGAMELRDFFKFEFFYPPKSEFKERLRREMSRQNANADNFLNAGGKAVGDLLESFSPLFAHASLKPYVEAYSIVAEAVLNLKPNDPVDEKNIIASCLKLGRDAVLRQRITGEESIATYLYSNGYRLAANRGLVDGDPLALAGERIAFSREIKDLQRRLRLIESIAARRRSRGDFELHTVEAEAPVRSAGRQWSQ